MSNYFIPEPCHENWNKMTPKEQGRHCDVCSKVVVDFTRKSETEVNEILGAQDNVCGHFRVDQLNHDAQVKVFKKPSNLFNRNIKYLAFTALGFFMINKKAEGQIKGKMKIAGGPKAVQDFSNSSEIKLTGTVLTPEGKPAGGAVINFSSGGREIAKVIALANGTYSYTFKSGSLEASRVNIHVTHRYYLPKDIQSMQLNNAKNTLNIKLEEEMMIMGKIAMPTTVDGMVKQVPRDSIKEQKIEKTCTLQEVKKTDTTQKVNKTNIQNSKVGNTDRGTNAEEKNDPVINVVFVAPHDELVRTIYPNPTSDHATIQCSKTALYQLEVYDAKGTRYMQTSFTGDRTDLDISALAGGTYFVKVRDEAGEAQTLRLVKQ